MLVVGFVSVGGGGCHGGATSSYVITVYGCCGGCVVVADVVLGNYDVANIGAAAAAFAAPDFNLFFFDLPKVVLCVHAQLHLYLNWNSIHRVCA